MKKLKMITALAAATMLAGPFAQAGGHQMVDEIHFLIPGGAGGGWDGTARGTGQARRQRILREHVRRRRRQGHRPPDRNR